MRYNSNESTEKGRGRANSIKRGPKHKPIHKKNIHRRNPHRKQSAYKKNHAFEIMDDISIGICGKGESNRI